MVAVGLRVRVRATATAFALAACCVSLVIACGGSSSSGAAGQDSGPIDSTSPESGGACVPGASVACAGQGGCAGYQVCNQSGTGFEPCDCTVDSGHDVTLSTDSGGDATATDGQLSDRDADVTDVFVSNDGPAVVRGAIQKGPFVLGSTVTLSAIDTSGVPTGQVFNTQTSDDLGDFAVSFSYRGNVDMQAQGFYYDEVTGSLSSAAIVLRALYQVTNGGPQGAYINIITHLAHDRALALTSDAGMGLQAAEAQAEAELVTALGIGGTGFQPGGVGVNLNELGGDNDQNAYLFAVSAVLVQAAREQAGDGGSVDAQLQQLIDTIAADLVSGGPLPSGLISQLRTAEQDLDVDLTMDLFTMRLQAIGSTAAIADLNRAIDSDGDGYRNSIDTCPLVANPNQSQIPTGVLCKVTRHTTFLTTTPATFGTWAPLLADFENTGHVGLFGQGLGGGTWPSTIMYDAGLMNGDGTGRFSPMVSVTMPSTLYNVVTFDVDSDGIPDLVDPTNGWSKGDGAGHFGSVNPFPEPAMAADAAAPSYSGVVIGNFNGDAFLDVARMQYCSSPGCELVVSLGTAKGVFGPAAALSAGLPSAATWTHTMLVLANVNGNTHPDLIAVDLGDFGATTALALLGDGAGGFQAAPLAPFTSTEPVYGSAAADFDGDGQIDIAVCYRLGEIDVAYGDGTGSFGAVSTTNLSNDAYCAAGDFNRDGKADLIAHAVNTTALLISTGRSFASPQALRTSPIASWLNSSYSPGLFPTGDLNGDGTPDVVLVTDDTAGRWSAQGIIMGVLQ